jgi:Rrf2 family protein
VFSKTSQYAMRATAVVGQASREGKRLTLDEIAERTGAPKAFTAKVLQQLVHGGIIRSRRGPNGGFELPPSHARKVNLRMIMDAIGEGSFRRECTMGLASCSGTNPCPLHEQFAPVKERMSRILENTDVHSLVDDLNTGATHIKL